MLWEHKEGEHPDMGECVGEGFLEAMAHVSQALKFASRERRKDILSMGCSRSKDKNSVC